MLRQPPARNEGKGVCSHPGLVSGLTPSGSCMHKPVGPGPGRGQPPVPSSAAEHSQAKSSQAGGWE